MTSEGPHRPGQEPDEVPPGGGSAPYGDRSAQQDSGYGANAPDLGWAPPPPARPDASTPAWAGQQGAPWGAAQATRQAESPTSGGQPAWSAQGDQREQAGQGWAPTAPSTSDQPAWASGEQAGPTWADSTTPDTAQPAEWTPTQPASGQPADWAGGQPASGQPVGWGGGQQPEWNSSPRTDDPTPGWAAAANAPESALPDWAQTDQPTPMRAEPAARATAQVPQADAAAPHRPGLDEPARAGNWQSEQQEPPAWATGQQREPAVGGWAGEQPAEGWQTGGDRPAQPDWATPQPAESAGWSGGDATAQPAGWPNGDPAAQPPGWSGGDAAAQPTGWSGGGPAAQSAGWPNGDAAADERPQWSPPAQDRPAAAWTPEPATGSARPGDSGPLPSRTAADRSPLPDIEPWAPGEAWGSSAGSAEAASARPEAEAGPGRPEESPVYQPAPAPGISPANMVPLPPQEQRVPGASLAAAPPADYAPPTPFTGEQAAGPYPGADQPSGGMGWGQPESRHEEPQSPSGPAIPAPRTSPEAAGRATPPPAGGVSASASVPLASRVMPPADHAARPTDTPAPQPRVYGRPSRPEQPEEPAAQEQRGDQSLAPRFDQAPDPRFADREPPAGGPNPYPGAAAPASPAAFPPGLPSFADVPPSNRPLNGVRPHAEPERPVDPFGAPPGNQFGASPGDPFGAPSDRPGGTYGAARPEPGADHTSAFPPPTQSGPAWSPSGAPEPDQGRFDAFKPVAEPAPETPAPKVRNGRVLAAVLVAAVLILAIPLGLLMLLGMVGGSDEPGGFDPAIGSCVKRSGETAVVAECTEADAFTVVSKVEAKDKCPDPAQPHVELRGNAPNRVLCLKDAAS
ncbi:LppU/SCO3897 family protein [Micromonospora sp. CA-263727]|uniref:LppU/SCO3897 family protein n=1 Tax=Micromonospora sp. CA-263727 TaxID=3239967 RepID=UPI003D89C837